MKETGIRLIRGLLEGHVIRGINMDQGFCSGLLSFEKDSKTNQARSVEIRVFGT